MDGDSGTSNVCRSEKRKITEEHKKYKKLKTKDEYKNREGF